MRVGVTGLCAEGRLTFGSSGKQPRAAARCTIDGNHSCAFHEPSGPPQIWPSRATSGSKRKARKEEELLKKREEVKRLKALKMKDLQSRLEKIGKEGGKSLASKGIPTHSLSAL